MNKKSIFIWIFCCLTLSSNLLRSQETIINKPKKIQYITEAINMISADSIYSHIDHLQKFNTRFELNDNRFDVSQWIFDKFKSFELTDVVFDTFSAPIKYSTNQFTIDSTFLQRNVICTIKGDDPSEELCLIIAHYDSYTQGSSMKISVAPGADDNGSGVASLIEIARIIKKSNITPKRTIVIAALAAEELTNYGYSGAIHVAERLLSKSAKVKFVLNVDMIGFSNKQTSHSLYIGTDDTSSPYGEYAKKIIRENTGVWGVPVTYWGGDLRAFVNAGFKGIYFEEYEFNPNYHSSNDILSNVNIDYCTQSIRSISAVLLQMSNIPSTVEVLNTTPDPYNDNTIQFTWNSNDDFDFDSYKLYLSKDRGVTFSTIVTSDTILSVPDLLNKSDLRYAITAKTIDNYEGIGIIREITFNELYVDNTKIVHHFELKQNYPNPFNPSTTINFSIPVEGQVKLTIHSIDGNIVKELFNGYQNSGEHSITWMGKNDTGEFVSSGMYIIKLKAQNVTIVKKMLLIR